MSLLDTFRSLPIGRLKPDISLRWMSGLRSRLPFSLAAHRSPELVPGMAAIILLLAAGLQLSLPSAVELPQDTVRPPPPPAPIADPARPDFPAILARPVFAPDRAPVREEMASSGNLTGFEVLGVAIAGSVGDALVRDPMGKISRIKTGAILQGWKLVSIEPRQLTFDRNGERRSLAIDMTHRAATRGPVATSQASGDDDDSDSSSNDDSDE